MTGRGRLLATVCVTSVVLAAAFVRGADLSPAVVTNPTGTLRIVQGIPCGGTLDQTTAVTGGRVELAPAEGVDAGGGSRYFALTRADIVFAPFSMTGSCLGISETRSYGPVHVQLAQAVSFVAAPTPAPDVFQVRIPRAEFLVHYATTANGVDEFGTKVPSEDVTGTIDLAAGTARMRVVLANRVTYRALCTGLGCVIDETHDGSMTVNVGGDLLLPDTDLDGVPDRADNCRFTPNASQAPVPTPAITAPRDATLASCLSRSFGAGKAADVCDGAAVALTNDAPLRFDAGSNLVTWRAQDAMGRVATAAQTVTVVDSTPPTFTTVPANLSLSDCGPAALGLPAATDDCAGSPVLSNDAPAIFYAGSTPVTWTATDVAGNRRTAVQTVTVTDTAAPGVTCVPTQPTGRAFRVSASDACLGAPVIRLGGFVLADGEVIHLNESGRAGVRLVNAVRSGELRHFLVGRGEAVITATDAAGNMTSVACSSR